MNCRVTCMVKFCIVTYKLNTHNGLDDYKNYKFALIIVLALNFRGLHKMFYMILSISNPLFNMYDMSS